MKIYVLLDNDSQPCGVRRSPPTDREYIAYDLPDMEWRKCQMHTLIKHAAGRAAVTQSNTSEPASHSTVMTFTDETAVAISSNEISPQCWIYS